MFDANLRYQQKGDDGFCEVWSMKENTKLYNLGIRKRDVLYYKMLSIGHRNPRVKLYTSENKSITVRSWDSEYGSRNLDFWIVYSGDTDLTGFFPEEEDVLEKAKVLKEKLGL